MKQRQRTRSIVILIVMVFLGLGYLALLYTQYPLWGTFKADGIVSVLAGLYIASQPVANGLDFILYRRYMAGLKTSRGGEIIWWLLNLVVLGLGWWVISVGMVRFSV